MKHWRTAIDDLRDENARLWKHIGFLESRNQELHNNLVRMHRVGYEAMVAEAEHAVTLKQIEADGIRVERGLKPKVEEAARIVDGEPADFSHIPGGDGPPEGDGSLM